METPTRDTAAPRQDAQDEGLIEVTDIANRGFLHHAVRVFVFAIALTAIVGTAAVDSLYPIPLPKLVGRGKIAAEKRRDHARIMDGTRAQLVEHELRLTSSVRRYAGQRYARTLFYWLHEAQGKLTLIGPDGWIFVRSRTIPPNTPTNAILNQWSANIVALRRGMASLGMNLFVIPLPRRAVVEASHLPRGVDPRPDIDLKAAKSLKGHGLDAVDLYPAYMNWKLGSLFYRGDAHWNELGEKLSAKETMRELGMLVPSNEREGYIRRAGVETQGLQTDLNRELFWLIGILPPKGSNLLRGSDVPILECLPFKGASSGNRKNPKVMPAIALTGTSFASRRKFAPLLEHYGQVSIFDASDEGKGPITPIREFVRAHRDELPELVLAEIPIYTSFGFEYPLGREVTRFLIEFPPAVQDPFGPVPLGPSAHALGQELTLRVKAKELFATSHGALFTSWDNLIGLRIRGEVLSGVATFKSGARPGEPSIKWEIGTHDSLLPLLGLHLRDNRLRLLAQAPRGPARVRIDSIEFVTTVKLSNETSLTRLDSGVRPNRWFTDFELEAADKPGQDRALVVGPWEGESWNLDQVWVSVIDPETRKWRRTLGRGYIAKGGWVVLSVGETEPDKKTVIRFSGLKNQKAPPIHPSVFVVNPAGD